MIVEANARRQVTIPPHILDAIGVVQTTNSNSLKRRTDTCCDRGASTAHASER